MQSPYIKVTCFSIYWNGQLEVEIKSMISNNIKNIKHLGIHLTNICKSYTLRNYKTLLREVRTYINAKIQHVYGTEN